MAEKTPIAAAIPAPMAMSAVRQKIQFCSCPIVSCLFDWKLGPDDSFDPVAGI